ncbi:MAG: hypothetical protein O6851_00985 [Gemmatimonadetes bacterium]|nr:hypothetical protein [Gemmatimonadota bacterium]
MRDSRFNDNDSRGRENHSRRNTLRSCLLMTAVGLAGCGENPMAPQDVTREKPTNNAAPFSLEVFIQELDEELCQVRVTAVTSGGQDGSYAEWGELEGSSYDHNTRGYTGVSRTQQLYPDVFDAQRMERGETQWGELDLELYRRAEGIAVMVKLEFHYWVMEDGRRE